MEKDKEDLFEELLNLVDEIGADFFQEKSKKTNDFYLTDYYWALRNLSIWRKDFKKYYTEKYEYKKSKETFDLDEIIRRYANEYWHKFGDSDVDEGMVSLELGCSIREAREFLKKKAAELDEEPEK